MENQPQNQTPQNFDRNDEKQMLQEILANSRKTKNYMMWQLIITVAFVILPLVAALIMVPIALNSLGSIYGAAGLGGGTESGINIDPSQLEQLKQYLQ